MNRRGFLQLLMGSAAYEAGKRLYVLPPVGGWSVTTPRIKWVPYRQPATIPLTPGPEFCKLFTYKELEILNRFLHPVVQWEVGK